MIVLPRLFLWFSQVKHFECHYIQPPTRGTVCAHVQCGWDMVFCTNHYLTVLINNIATCVEHCVDSAQYKGHMNEMIVTEPPACGDTHHCNAVPLLPSGRNACVVHCSLASHQLSISPSYCRPLKGCCWVADGDS